MFARGSPNDMKSRTTGPHRDQEMKSLYMWISLHFSIIVKPRLGVIKESTLLPFAYTLVTNKNTPLNSGFF